MSYIIKYKRQHINEMCNLTKLLSPATYTGQVEN